MSSFGLEKEHRDLMEAICLKVLQKRQSLKVWIFGSRATHTHKPFSDVDLLLESVPPLTLMQLSQLTEELEESNLPFKVDLVATENLYPPYAAKIDLEKKLLFDLQA